LRAAVTRAGVTSLGSGAAALSGSALVTWVAALPRLAQSPDVSVKVIASPFFLGVVLLLFRSFYL
jgi:hypothetical protein